MVTENRKTKHFSHNFSQIHKKALWSAWRRWKVGKQHSYSTLCTVTWMPIMSESFTLLMSQSWLSHRQQICHHIICHYVLAFIQWGLQSLAQLFVQELQKCKRSVECYTAIPVSSSTWAGIHSWQSAKWGRAVTPISSLTCLHSSVLDRTWRVWAWRVLWPAVLVSRVKY